MEQIEIETEKITAYDTIEKTVKPQGNGAMVLVPKNWIGKRVKVILLGSDYNLHYTRKERITGNHRLTVLTVQDKIVSIKQEQLVNGKWTRTGTNWYNNDEILKLIDEESTKEEGICKKEVISDTGDVVYVTRDELGLEYYI